jgi:hypothetical protein
MKYRGAVGLVLWLLALVGSAAWILWANGGNWHYFWLTLGRMSEHWLLTALAVLLGLMASGQLGAGLGLPQLFHDEPETPLAHSRAFWGAFGAAVFFAEAWTVIDTLEFLKRDHYPPPALDVSDAAWGGFPEAGDGRYGIVRHLKFLAVGGVPWLALFILAASLPAPVPGAPARRRSLAGREFLRYLLGVAAAVALYLLFSSGGNLVFHLLDGSRRFVTSPLWLALRAQRLIDPGPRNAAVAVLGSFLVLEAAAGLVMFFSPARRVILPGLGLGVLCWMLGGFYLLLASVQTAYQPVLLLAVALLAVVGNTAEYKYRLPGMGQRRGRSVYERCQRLVLEEVTGASPADAARAVLADDRQALERWLNRVRGLHGEPRPKLVVLTVAGGAYRSGFWAATVLDEMARRAAPGGPLEGFLDHIRVITGASGGLVGAGYYVAMCADGSPPDGRQVCTVDRLATDTGRDSLTPVVRQFVSRDLPLTFWPGALFPEGYQREDRGTVLDRQWPLLGRSVSSLTGLEAAGTVPSLIISPMVVETGRRMLISNLDLLHLTVTRPELGAESPRSAVEFFKLFPEARDTFSLQTAVRTSATFPYASPAVSLPTEPPRRLVDAGYYDNYGVNLAAAWAYHHREWVLENTSGLALIELHAYATLEAKRNGLVIGRPADNAAARFFAKLRQSVQGLTSPVEAAISARDWSMSFRNDEQVGTLHDYLNGRSPGMFRSFAFENPTEFAMNWFLSRDDIDLMRDRVAAGENGREFDRLAGWWGERSGDPGRAT